MACPPEQLVLALCHEVGNILAAIRLHGELAEEGAGARVSELAGRAGALLALVRPLLSPVPPRGAALDPLDLLEGLQRGLDEAGHARVRIQLESALDLPGVDVDAGILYHLLLADLFAALEHLPAGDRVRVAAEASPEGVSFVLEAPGDPARDSPVAKLAGRALTRALAELLLAERGGGVAVNEGDSGTCVAFTVPAARGQGGREAD